MTKARLTAAALLYAGRSAVGCRGEVTGDQQWQTVFMCRNEVIVH